MHYSNRGRQGGIGGVVLLLVGCAATAVPVVPAEPAAASRAPAATTQPVASAKAAQPALPVLPTGALPPIEHDVPVLGQLVAAEQTAGIQTLYVTLSKASLAAGFADGIPLGTVARLRGQPAQPVTVLRPLFDLRPGERDPGADSAAALWVRRVVAQGAPDQPLVVDVYTPAQEVDDAAQPGHHFQVTVAPPQAPKADAKLFKEYLTALGYSTDDESPVRWLLTPHSGASRLSGETPDFASDWADLMRFTSGYDSIEAALVSEEKLRSAGSAKRATLALASLKAPELPRHPWSEMLRALPGQSPAEALARATPSEFYYVRARSFDAFQALVDEVDDFLTPALYALEPKRQVRHLSERYRLELGLPQDDLSRLLGPSVISSLALVGSDPFVREGSDLSLIFAAPNTETLLRLLAVKREAIATSTPLTTTSFQHRGVTVSVSSSADGAVRQHVASYRVEGLEQPLVLVSNSPNAVRRILDAGLANVSPLGAEPDFEYMLKRDAQTTGDVLAYFGDRFVAAAVSPRQRIVDARRQVARAELATVGYAALVYGLVYGRPPKDVAELTAAAWFPKSRLTHAAGEKIAFVPGTAPRSAWGSPGRLTSLIDLPTPARVTLQEKSAYEDFTRQYVGMWSDNIDPIGVRANVHRQAGQTKLDVNVRVLPLMNSGDYNQVLRLSGGASTTRSPSLPAVAAILALGEDSPLRRTLALRGGSLLGGSDKLDWLGRWVELGLADEVSVASVALTSGQVPLPPQTGATHEPDDWQRLTQLPVYAAIEVNSMGGAAVALTALREMASGSAPDVVQWGEFKKHGDVTLVRIHAEDITIYYALTKQRLLISFRSEVLEKLIDAQQAEASPGGKTPAPSLDQGGQLVVELAPRPAQSPLLTVMGWMLEGESRSSAQLSPLGQLLLLGAPEGAATPAGYTGLALAYFGGEPVTNDGQAYTWSNAGLTDPARGTLHAPLWPAIPVPGSALQHLVSTLLGVRAELAVDTEPSDPSLRSLRSLIQVRTSR